MAVPRKVTTSVLWGFSGVKVKLAVGGASGIGIELGSGSIVKNA